MNRCLQSGAFLRGAVIGWAATAVRLAVLAGAVCFLPGVAAPALAQGANRNQGGGELRILCSNGIKGAMETLVAQYQKSSGVKISIEYNATAVLKRRMEADEAFDVAVLANPTVDQLIESGKVAKGTHADIATAPLAAGIRRGGAKADIGSAEKMKARLLAAKSITFAKEGAATAAFVAMFQKLGIEAALEPKLVRQTVTGRPAESVAEGENEVVLAPVSEIRPVAGLDVLGLIPQEFQKPIVMAAGVSAKAKDAAAAKAFVSYVTGKDAVAALRATGMEPVGK
ncbi:MAG: substrate-binding domain-containing protein [Bryobacteraceae bacterium]